MNLDLIKAALQEKDNPDQRRGGGSDKLWRLDAGDSEAEALARIVPYKFDEDNPFLEMWFHYGVAGRNYLCPRKHGDGECVICKFGYEVLEEYKRTKNEETRLTLSVLLPKLRVYSPVVIRGEEEAGVRFWGYSPTLHHELLKIAVQFGEQDIDITDPERGVDIKVHVVSPDQSGKLYPITDVAFAMDGVSAKIDALVETEKGAPSKSKISKLLDTCPDISEIYNLKPESELIESLEKYAQPQGQKENPGTGTEKFGGSSEKEEEKPAADMDQIGQDFEKMLENDE